MKLVQVDKIPEEGYFVVTGISTTGYPFGVSILAKDGQLFEYQDSGDGWNEVVDTFFSVWHDLKYFVIKED